MVVFFRGIEVSNEGEVSRRVILGIPGHFSPVHSLDPFGGTTLPVFAQQVDVDLASVFFISGRGLFEWLFHIDPLLWDPCSLKIIEGLFEESLFDGVSVLHSSEGFHHRIDDPLEYHGVKVLPLGDVMC